MVENEFEGGLAAASATDVNQLPPDYRASFAEQVARTLEAVFGFGQPEAVEKVRVYFEEGDIAPSLFTYHLSPLQIAADLASAHDRPLSDEELRRYRDFIDGPTPVDRPTSQEWGAHTG